LEPGHAAPTSPADGMVSTIVNRSRLPRIKCQRCPRRFPSQPVPALQMPTVHIAALPSLPANQFCIQCGTAVPPSIETHDYHLSWWPGGSCASFSPTSRKLTMYCSACGRENPPNARFCGHCGKPQVPIENARTLTARLVDLSTQAMKLSSRRT
jgi:rRNA maturation endonuclease Nob1